MDNAEMKGEFEKRIEEENYEYYIPETPDKVRVVRVKKIHKIVDEARNEFPWDVLCNIGHPMFKSDEKRLRQWFEKWFGSDENK